MPFTNLCNECHEPLRDDLALCPHCGRPGLFPNVHAAERVPERDALQARYEAALTDAKSRGTEAALAQLEALVTNSSAVIARQFGELVRLTYSEDEIYATFYQRVEAGLRLPGGDRWDRLRAVADTLLFGERNKTQVRFAALALDGSGLENYGDCSITLKSAMIAHRASAFEENTVLFMRKHDVRAENDYRMPPGYRAPWSGRQILAVAKLGPQVEPAFTRNDFERLLLSNGPDSESDQFIEIHIWGPLTIRSIHEISVRRWITEPSPTELKCLEEKLAQYKIAFRKP